MWPVSQMWANRKVKLTTEDSLSSGGWIKKLCVLLFTVIVVFLPIFAECFRCQSCCRRCGVGLRCVCTLEAGWQRCGPQWWIWLLYLCHPAPNTTTSLQRRWSLETVLAATEKRWERWGTAAVHPRCRHWRVKKKVSSCCIFLSRLAAQRTLKSL